MAASTPESSLVARHRAGLAQFASAALLRFGDKLAVENRGRRRAEKRPATAGFAAGQMGGDSTV